MCASILFVEIFYEFFKQIYNHPNVDFKSQILLILLFIFVGTRTNFNAQNVFFFVSIFLFCFYFSCFLLLKEKDSLV